MVRPTSRVSRVLVTGPLGPFADAYREKLEERGYTRLSAVNLQRQVAQMSRWLVAERLGVDAAERGTRRGLPGRPARERSRPVLAVTAGPAVPARVVARAGRGGGAGPAGAVTDGGAHGLASGATCCPSVACRRAPSAATWTERRGSWPGWHPVGSRSVTSAEVTAAVLRESAAVSVSATQNFVASLRAFLRFCFIEGLIEIDLSQAALAVTGRRRSSLPRGIAKDEADALLASCDRRTAIGRRDYAVIITLLRLGLRRGEVAGLRLEDIDWRAGELVVVGKGARLDRLPLPADVGEAIAAYLSRGRPASDRRQVFLRARAPFEPIAAGTVASTVRRACRRAGVAEVGSHRLRHTAACEMVAAQVPLAEIAQVLRHRSLQSTAIYARVDLDRLRLLAQPWPEGGSR